MNLKTGISPGNHVFVFDLGGVLVEINHTWKTAAATAGLDLREEFDHPFETFQEFLDYQKGDLTEAKYYQALQHRLLLDSESQAKSVHQSILKGVFPSTERLLQHLSLANFKIACLSNTNEPHALEMEHSDRFSSLQKISPRLYSHNLRSKKPSTEIFEMAETMLNIQPGQAVFWDDVEENVVAAKAAGWNAFVVPKHVDPPSWILEQLI